MWHQHPLSSHLLVFIQGTGMLLATFPVHLSAHRMWLLILPIAGALLAAWTVYHNRIHNFSVYPEIKQGAQLITTGPYRWVRHPMYLSLFLLMAGIAFYGQGWSHNIGLMLVATAIMLKIEKEEKYLLATFPDYQVYRQNTCKLFWPVY